MTGKEAHMRVLAMMLGAVAAYGQAPPAFEVASVKPAPYKGSGFIGGVMVRGNTLTAEHASLNDLVTFAYNLRSVQLSGGPAWAERGVITESELFEVIGKSAGDPPPPMDIYRQMLQTLLADRFKLQVHHVQKEFAVYNLVVNKGGPKLKDSPEDTKYGMNVYSLGRFGIRIQATSVTIQQLVDNQLVGYAERPVFNKTGLTGKYDFMLEFVTENLPPGAEVGPNDGPALVTALQQQIGLKLEPGTAPFDTVVIDHAERPSGN
jgi:uncharacterized protein (TIGR03435 family)